MDASVIQALGGMGAAGAVIAVVLIYRSSLKDLSDQVGRQLAAMSQLFAEQLSAQTKAYGDQIALLTRSQDERVATFVEQLRRIEERHVEEDRAGREQSARQFKMLLDMSGRTIDVHTSLVRSIESLQQASEQQAIAAKKSVESLQAVAKLASAGREPT